MLRFPIIFHIEYLLPNLEFIKSNRYQIRTVNIKALLFFRYSVDTSVLESYGIPLSDPTKIWLVKTFDHLPYTHKKVNMRYVLVITRIRAVSDRGITPTYFILTKQIKYCPSPSERGAFL